MATATNALATLAPYAPPDGLGPREILAHAKDHIDRLTKRHSTLQGKIQDTQKYTGCLAKTGLAFATTLAVSSGLGFINGRYGGAKGHAAPLGVPIDFTAGVLAHGVGLTVGLLSESDFGELCSRGFHTVGDAALGIGTYRTFQAIGLERAARATGQAPGAGVSATNPNGQRPGTTYAVPQK
jgi:hypothetical protein